MAFVLYYFLRRCLAVSEVCFLIARMETVLGRDAASRTEKKSLPCVVLKQSPTSIVNRCRISEIKSKTITEDKKLKGVLGHAKNNTLFLGKTVTPMENKLGINSC